MQRPEKKQATQAAQTTGKGDNHHDCCGNCSGDQRITSIEIKAGQHVAIEDLLMKLALATQTAHALSDFSDSIAENDGVSQEYHPAPDTWAISGMFQNLDDIAHALKAACWGHRKAFLH